MNDQLSFDGVGGRCGHVEARTEPQTPNPACVLVCIAAPHDDDVAHHHVWREETSHRPVRLVALNGGAL